VSPSVVGMRPVVISDIFNLIVPPGSPLVISRILLLLVVLNLLRFGWLVSASRSILSSPLSLAELLLV